jgi:hypothetical protein
MSLSRFILLSVAVADALFVRVPNEHLFPSAMKSRTRAAHRQMMRSWRAPERSAGSAVIFPADFGADPTGKADSSAAFAAALVDMLSRGSGNMSDGIKDLGGVVMDLQGGEYLLSAPLVIPQFFGNMRFIDGTLRAMASTFNASRYLVEVGATPCKTRSGQGSCNENVGFSGLTLDGAHVAAGCLKIAATMGATLDASSAVFGFVDTGILLEGGHEVMISETWVAAYFWSSPNKEKNNATGILVAGNDHFVSNTIVFSARIGIDTCNGCAANKFLNVHTWNCATGNGGIGIRNRGSQNIFIGAYLDFTDFVLQVAQQVSFSSGFFLGDAQVVLEAQKPNDSVTGVTFFGNVWYDCDLPAFAVNETLGRFLNVVDFTVVGTSFCGNALSKATGLPAAGKSFTWSAPPSPYPTNVSFDFSDVLLFPSAGIASAQIVHLSPSMGISQIIGPLPTQDLVIATQFQSLSTIQEQTNVTIQLFVDQSSRSSISPGGALTVNAAQNA